MPAALSPELLLAYEQRREDIRARLDDFAAVPPSQYFYELCYCLLTPQSSAKNVSQVISILEQQSFLERPFDPSDVLRSPKHYVRFHLTKSKRLLIAREQFSEIAAVLGASIPAEEKRSWLVEHVNGLSLKEASHFLRNIGTRNLAIIDRHILTHLVGCGVIRRKPISLTPRRYSIIERKFRMFAASVGITMDELDLLFWSNETGIILK